MYLEVVKGAHTISSVPAVSFLFPYYPVSRQRLTQHSLGEFFTVCIWGRILRLLTIFEPLDIISRLACLILVLMHLSMVEYLRIKCLCNITFFPNIQIFKIPDSLTNFFTDSHFPDIISPRGKLILGFCCIKIQAHFFSCISKVYNNICFPCSHQRQYHQHMQESAPSCFKWYLPCCYSGLLHRVFLRFYVLPKVFIVYYYHQSDIFIDTSMIVVLIG